MGKNSLFHAPRAHAVHGCDHVRTDIGCTTTGSRVMTSGDAGPRVIDLDTEKSQRIEIRSDLEVSRKPRQLRLSARPKTFGHLNCGERLDKRRRCSRVRSSSRFSLAGRFRPRTRRVVHSLECAVGVRNRPWSQRETEVRFPFTRVVGEASPRLLSLESSSRRDAERSSRARTTGSCREAHRVDRAAHHPEFKSHTIGFVRLAARDFAGSAPSRRRAQRGLWSGPRSRWRRAGIGRVASRRQTRGIWLPAPTGRAERRFAPTHPHFAETRIPEKFGPRCTRIF